METITAKCAHCGKEATYDLDDDEFIMFQLYQCFGRQLGSIQDLFPKVPPWIRSGAIDLPVQGAINGWCYLVPYNGKIRNHTEKTIVDMFIPLMRYGQKKLIGVSVVEEDRIIYMDKDVFRVYEKSLNEPEGIKLIRASF